MRYLLSESSAAIVRELASRRGGVAFAARRIASPPGSSPGGGQWRIETYADPEGVAVRVGAGLVAWGAGVTYRNPGEDPLAVLAPGESIRIVWATGAGPIPLVYDPRWPKGDAPRCGCCDDGEGNCHRDTGDAAAGGGDSGAILAVPDDWTPGSNVTDSREIGSVSVSDSGGVSVVWIQRDTIVARAIVGKTNEKPDPDESVPPCGHPMNHEDDYNPISGGSAAGNGHPLDEPGDGGYTPLCKNDPNLTA